MTQFTRQLLLCAASIVLLVSCGKGTKSPEEGSENQITFTTEAAIGETVKLKIVADTTGGNSVWIDLNGNKQKDNGEAVTIFKDFQNYVTGAQTLTIYGNVKEFQCGNNKITALDVSKAPDLTNLGCTSNQMTTLDLSKNTKLEYLYCFSNKLTNIDVSKNTALKYFDCANNSLTSIDISNNTELLNLSLNTNQIAKLDVSKNTKISTLYANENNISSLDVSNCKSISWLIVNNNNISELKMPISDKLSYVKIYRNQIKGEVMTKIMEALPKVTSSQSIYVIDTKAPQPDGNEATKADVAIATAKGWKVQDYGRGNNADYKGK